MENPNLTMFLVVINVANLFNSIRFPAKKNINNLIRQFVPYGTTIDGYNKQYVDNIVDRIK